MGFVVVEGVIKIDLFQLPTFQYYVLHRLNHTFRHMNVLVTGLPLEISRCSRCTRSEKAPVFRNDSSLTLGCMMHRRRTFRSGKK